MFLSNFHICLFKIFNFLIILELVKVLADLFQFKEPQMIISFIPTAKPTQSLSHVTSKDSQSISHSKQLDDFARLPPQYEVNNHPFLNESVELR